MSIYEHHVFISYRQIAAWKDWVRTLFVPTLRNYLSLELPDPVSIFVDDKIDNGASWKHSIDLALARSRVMVPVFSSPYFSSKPCCEELARMLHREEMLGFRSSSHPEGLIHPVLLSSNRSYFPPVAKEIQDEDLREFAIAHLSPNTPTRENFDRAVKSFAERLAVAIRNSPVYDSTWELLDGAHLVDKILLTTEPALLEPPRIK